MTVPTPLSDKFLGLVNRMREPVHRLIICAPAHLAEVQQLIEAYNLTEYWRARPSVICPDSALYLLDMDELRQRIYGGLCDGPGIITFPPEEI